MTSSATSLGGEIDMTTLRAQDPTGLLDGIAWDLPLSTRFRGLTHRDGSWRAG